MWSRLSGRNQEQLRNQGSAPGLVGARRRLTSTAAVVCACARARIQCAFSSDRHTILTQQHAPNRRPDRPQAKLYPRVLAAMKPGATLGLSHGFLLGVMQSDNVDFRKDVNVVLVAPKVRARSGSVGWGGGIGEGLCGDGCGEGWLRGEAVCVCAAAAAAVAVVRGSERR